jgi:hypothetical protein
LLVPRLEIITLKGRLAVKKIGSVLLMVAFICTLGGIVGCPATKTTTPPPPAADAKKADAADAKKADAADAKKADSAKK